MHQPCLLTIQLCTLPKCCFNNRFFLKSRSGSAFRKAARCLEQLPLPLKHTDTFGTVCGADGKGAPTPRWVTPSPREAPAPSGLQRPWKAREGGIQAGGLRKQQPDRGVGIHREPCTAPRRLEGAGRRRLRADFSAVDGSGALGWGRRHGPPRPAEPPSPAGSGAALPCQPQPRRPRTGPSAPPPAHAQGAPPGAPRPRRQPGGQSPPELPGAPGPAARGVLPGPAAPGGLSRGKFPSCCRCRVKLQSLPLTFLPKPPCKGCWDGDPDTFISQFFFFGQEMCVEGEVEIVNFIDYLQTVQSIFKLS